MTAGQNILEQKNYMNKRRNVMKIILGTSIALDLFLYICFFIGFALALGGAKAGYWMIGIGFRCGPALSIISILLKLIPYLLY